MITKQQLEYWYEISPEIKSILKEYQEQIENLRADNKDLKTQVQKLLAKGASF